MQKKLSGIDPFYQNKAVSQVIEPLDNADRFFMPWRRVRRFER